MFSYRKKGRSPSIACKVGKLAQGAWLKGHLIALLSALSVLSACAGPQQAAEQHPAQSTTPPVAQRPNEAAIAPSAVSPPSSPQAQTAPADSRQVEGYALLKGCLMTLEVADTPEERARGLMERSSLPSGHGMLFVHQKRGPWAFWMLNTLVPLDILWLEGDGTIVDIQTMKPEPGVPPERLTLYNPRSDALFSIETGAGLARRLGLATGDRIELNPNAAVLPPGVPRCP